MKILIIDNYDSFTYNLVQLIRQLAPGEPVVKRNDRLSLDEVSPFDRILLSPGPGLPSQAGLMPELIKNYAAHKSILGICLGHQAIAEAFGATLARLENVYHGLATTIRVSAPDPLFKGVPETFAGGRYHSWVVSKDNLPGQLQVLSEDEQGHIMALRHREYNVCGLQFHPESMLTPQGMQIIANWINTSL